MSMGLSGAKYLAKSSGIGGMLGDAASSLISSVIGQGDYTEVPNTVPIDSNTLMGVQTPEAAQVPAMHRDKGATRITHREYIGDIPMTTDFACTTYEISPVNGALFPWLKYPASAFSEYSVSGLIFEVKSLAANAIAGTNAGMGSITAYVNYDVYANAPRSKVEANNAMFAVSCKPSESMMCPVECDPSENPAKILRIGQVGTEDSDRHFYSIGNLQIITQGASAPYPAAAELWATYDIYLYKPVLTGLGDPLMTHLTLSGSTTALLPLSVNTNQSYGVNTFGVTINSSSSALVFPLTLPRGTLISIEYQVTGTATIGLRGPSFTFSGGLVAADIVKNASSSNYYPSGYVGISSATAMCTFYCYYDGTGTAFTSPDRKSVV